MKRRAAGQRRELFGLCVGTVFAFTGFTMTEPLVPLHAVALGASPGLLGILVGASAVGSLLIAVPGGVIVQRFGTRAPIVASCLLMAGCCLLPALLNSIAAIFAAMTLFEIGRIVLAVGVQGHFATLGDDRDTGLDFGWYGSAASVGQLIGPGAAGLLMDRFGYPYAWAAVVLVMLATGSAFLGLIGHGRFATPGAARPSYTGRRLRRLLNVPAMVAILASFAVVFANGARGTFFPLYMQRIHFGATVIGAMLSLRALVSVSCRLFMGWFVRICGGKFPALLASMAILSVGVGLTPLCGDVASLVGLSAVVGIGYGIAVPLSLASVADGVRPEDLGVAMGLRLSGTRLAQFVNPIFFGMLIQWFGISSAFWAAGLVLLGVTVPILVWWRQGRLAAPPGPGGGGANDAGEPVAAVLPGAADPRHQAEEQG